MSTRPKVQRTHTLPPTAPLSQQVGGHAGVHVTEDESLLLKPALPREIAFYQFARDVVDPSTGLHRLVDWMPQFIGLLNLEGKLADDAGISAGVNMLGPALPAIVPASREPDCAAASGDLDGTVTSSIPGQTLVLQNLLYGYRKPCVLDVKLGTVLYDDDASEEKKARMIKKAAESTTLTTGMRLTGFQVYSNHAPDPVVYGKAYGYSLRPDQLREGIEHFFPCSSSTNASKPGVGLPADTLVTLLTSLRTSLADLRTSIADAHVRMVGSSVLIIYEGDWERAAGAFGHGGGPRNVEDEDTESDEIEVEVDEQGQIVIDSIPGETTSEGSTSDPPPRLYTVSLIDFAHTRVVPGEGPDQGVLTGVDTLISLVDRRKQEVAALIEAHPNVQ